MENLIKEMVNGYNAGDLTWGDIQDIVMAWAIKNNKNDDEILNKIEQKIRG